MRRSKPAPLPGDLNIAGDKFGLASDIASADVPRRPWHDRRGRAARWPDLDFIPSNLDRQVPDGSDWLIPSPARTNPLRPEQDIRKFTELGQIAGWIAESA